MAKGQMLSSERKLMTDEKTGASVIKLTGFPTIHENFYMHDNCFTPDGNTLVFQSYRKPERGSPVDLYKVNTDGLGLCQITDGPVGGPLVSPVDRSLYFTRERRLIQMDLDSLSEREICAVPEEAASCGAPSMTFDGRVYVAQCTTKSGQNGAVRMTTDGNESRLLFRYDGFMSHLQCDPTDASVIAFQTLPDEEHRNIYLIDPDGGNLRRLQITYGNGHWMWHGPTRRIMSAREIVNGISLMGFGEETEEILTDTESCWHTGSSRDGKWVVSDTNWPDMGIWVYHTDTKKGAVLCYPNSSSCHPQWTHPHPGFSPDARTVVYKSDCDGYPNVYIAFVPDAMREELSSGVITK